MIVQKRTCFIKASVDILKLRHTPLDGFVYAFEECKANTTLLKHHCHYWLFGGVLYFHIAFSCASDPLLDHCKGLSSIPVRFAVSFPFQLCDQRPDAR